MEITTESLKNGIIGKMSNVKAPRWYPYFDVVVGLAWSHEPKSYAGSSVCYW
jgi:hypothetical protein